MRSKEINHKTIVSELVAKEKESKLQVAAIAF
jgi:hypothetical protein